MPSRVLSALWILCVFNDILSITTSSSAHLYVLWWYSVYLFVCECVFVCSFELVCVTAEGQGAVAGVKDCFVHAKKQCFLWIWRKSRYHHKQPVYGDTCKLASILVRPPYPRTVSPWSHQCSSFLFSCLLWFCLLALSYRSRTLSMRLSFSPSLSVSLPAMQLSCPLTNTYPKNEQ